MQLLNNVDQYVRVNLDAPDSPGSAVLKFFLVEAASSSTRLLGSV